LDDLVGVVRDCRSAKVRDFQWGPGAMVDPDAGERRGVQQQGERRRADSVALEQRDVAVPEHCLFALARVGDARAGRAEAQKVLLARVARQVAQQQAEVP